MSITFRKALFNVPRQLRMGSKQSSCISSAEQRIRERWGVAGVALADALSLFSLDVVGVVASYLRYGLLSDNELLWLNSIDTEMGASGKRASCMTIDALGRIWVSNGLNALRIYSEGGHFITQLCCASPQALTASATHIYGVRTVASAGIVQAGEYIASSPVVVQLWGLDLQPSANEYEVTCGGHQMERCAIACDLHECIFIAGENDFFMW